MKYTILVIAAVLATFAGTVLISRKLIPILKSHKMGQTILEIGPRWHKNKEGTPTMGGLAFIISSAVVGLIGCVVLGVWDGIKSTLPFVMTLALGIAGGLIGCVDDSAKLRKKQNEGLTPKQKLILQFLSAALYLLGMTLVCGIDTEVYIPFAGCEVDFGIAYYVIALLLIAGVMNSVNLTDGLDGLCSEVTLVVGIFVVVSGYLIGEAHANGGLLLLGSIMIGACGGFLVYNFYPARVFMGDTGSLFLGGLVVGASFMLDNMFIVIIYGIIYIWEALSDIIQVSVFKFARIVLKKPDGYRVFKMAPFHHHLEKCGWSEIKIGIVFSLITAAACAVSLAFGMN